jgi:hypothetical protein
VFKNPTPPNWDKLRGLMIAKFGAVHDDEIIMKPKAICQRPCQHIATCLSQLEYFIATCLSQLEKYFHSGQIDEAKQ